MKVGIFADGKWGLNFIKILISNKNFNIDFVVLRKKKDFKIFDLCKKKKIECLSFKNVNNKKSIEILKSFKSDLFISLSYNQIFKKNFLNSVKKKIINCHAGALPFYRGRSPINWAIINGEKKIGITTHFINSKIDQGDILDQTFISIKKKDNFKTLLEKCYLVCPKRLFKVLIRINKNMIKPIKQSSISKKGSYYFKRKKGDEIINFNNNFKKINNFIRGLVFPAVGATFYYNNKSYIVINSLLGKKLDIDNNLTNGTILYVSKKKLKIKIRESIIIFNNIYLKKNKVCVKDLRQIFKINSILIGSNV